MIMYRVITLVFVIILLITGCSDKNNHDKSLKDTLSEVSEGGETVIIVDPLKEGLDLSPYVSKTLTNFESSDSIVDMLNRINASNSRGVGASSSSSSSGMALSEISTAPLAADNASSITNNQEVGVDEGGIVKVFKEYFVILRKGRLFSVNMSDELAVSDDVPSYAEGSDLGVWYDELLIYHNKIIVLGYSYRMSATEIGMFSIDDEGKISHQNTYFLRSDDYYSSRNYASRLVGGELVFYMPYYLGYYNGSYEERLPALINARDLDGAGYEQRQNDDWQLLIQAESIMRPVKSLTAPSLHTIVRCNLDATELQCSAKGVIAPYSRSFYVSQNALYLWTNYYQYHSALSQDETDSAVVYRMSLENDDITLLEAYGGPIDQFSFKEDENYLHMLLQQSARGDWMWMPEFSYGDLMYAKIPLESFNETLSLLSDEYYKPLDNPGYSLTNRFVGDYLIYGTRYSGGNVTLVDTVSNAEPLTIAIGSTVNRIDKLGDGAIIVGAAFIDTPQIDDINESGDADSGGNSSAQPFSYFIQGNDLKLTSLHLGQHPMITGSYIIENAYEGENRSHGYNWARLVDANIFGLPIVRYREQTENNFDGQGMLSAIDESSFWLGGYEQSAEIMYFQTDVSFNLQTAGTIHASATDWAGVCQASCIDWYGNARPIFYQSKIYSLLGYELIEADWLNGEVFEMDRVDFMPSFHLQ